MHLFNPETERILCAIPYAWSHGATSERLGASMLYYSLVGITQARVAVCLGSGGGFIPCLMRQAQLDLGIQPSATYLVDAVLDAGGGMPDCPGGWVHADSAIRVYYPDINIIQEKTSEAVSGFTEESIDFLHIDADHSYLGVISDLDNYLPKVRPGGFITCHDLRMQSVQEAVTVVSAACPWLESILMPDWIAGLAILRKRI
jgi:hypothetical protein